MDEATGSPPEQRSEEAWREKLARLSNEDCALVAWVVDRLLGEVSQG